SPLRCPEAAGSAGTVGPPDPQDAVQRPLLRWFAALGPDPQAVEAPRRRPPEQRAREPVERAAPAGRVVVAGEEADPAAVGDVAPVPAPRADGGEPVRGGEPQGRRARAVGDRKSTRL